MSDERSSPGLVIHAEKKVGVFCGKCLFDLV